MFGPLGGLELLVLAAIGLLVFGPRKLPEIGRTLGKAMMQFRRATAELRNSIEREIDMEEVKKTTRSIKKTVEDDIKEFTGTLPSLDEDPEKPEKKD